MHKTIVSKQINIKKKELTMGWLVVEFYIEYAMMHGK